MSGDKKTEYGTLGDDGEIEEEVEYAGEVKQVWNSMASLPMGT